MQRKRKGLFHRNSPYLRVRGIYYNTCVHSWARYFLKMHIAFNLMDISAICIAACIPGVESRQIKGSNYIHIIDEHQYLLIDRISIYG